MISNENLQWVELINLAAPLSFSHNAVLRALLKPAQNLEGEKLIIFEHL